MNEGETIPCYECQKELETIYENGTLWVEPCPKCIEDAVKAEARKRFSPSEAEIEHGERIDKALEGYRRDYAEAERAKVIKFRHKGGFKDGTDFIEWDGRQTWIVSKNGARETARHYSLKTCERLVNEGCWEKEVA